MQIKTILNEYSLAKTPCRAEILRILDQASLALSEDEIRQQFTVEFDRATVFRTLRTFLEMNIIHRVMVTPTDIKYALTKDQKSKGNAIRNHAHFHCQHCDQVVCLGSLAVDQSSIPEGFDVKAFDIVVNGTCDRCKN
ncbi:MAG: transcriptional repressor [Bacteroidales bacterium]|nr:transcriptional repressor [Bacteroidales bacterium]